MASLVYFTTRAPAALTDSLIAAGHQVWEALAISEVLALCSQNRVDAVIIASDVNNQRSKAKQISTICMLLEATPETSEILWQIEQLFPSARKMVQ